MRQQEAEEDDKRRDAVVDDGRPGARGGQGVRVKPRQLYNFAEEPADTEYPPVLPAENPRDRWILP